jgi:hypothetical protein
MTTDRHVWTSNAIATNGVATATLARTPSRPSRTHAPICACGQDLDICTGENCPRCGALVGP